MFIARRKLFFPVGAGLLILFLGYNVFFRNPQSDLWPSSWQHTKHGGGSKQSPKIDPKVLDDEDYFWRKIPTHYPVQSMTPLPTGIPLKLPKIQTTFKTEDPKSQETRLERQDTVKKSFLRCWEAYKAHAWLQDEVTPISASSKNTFGGWGATLVDSLDTLYIMGLSDEFELAVSAAANISFERSSLTEINAFETTIRYLGGFLAAYDLSGDQRLLQKAREVGDMLYVAFDTPNRMPITRWEVGRAAQGEKQEASSWALVAEVGSLCMEFTRLSLITGNPKWFDATERIMLALKEQQMDTQLPGMWPISINAHDMKFTGDNTFGLGAMADSVFEYLPKMVALVGGLLPHYEEMYEEAMRTAIKYNLFKPITPDSADILISGTVHTDASSGRHTVEHQGQHLVCFAGGMLVVGGKLMDIPEHLDTARKLVDGCIWTYQHSPLGIMPETFRMEPCISETSCAWDETRWKQAILEAAGEDKEDLARADTIIAQRRLPKGFTEIPDSRYILRPEAIESVFVMYRATGDPGLLESAWAMFEAIKRNTETSIANSAIADVTVERPTDVHQTDSMESFWMGETLKYFYLIFSDPDLISLDEWVFNTEAHPLRRLVP